MKNFWISLALFSMSALGLAQTTTATLTPIVAVATTDALRALPDAPTPAIPVLSTLVRPQPAEKVFRENAFQQIVLGPGYGDFRRSTDRFEKANAVVWTVERPTWAFDFATTAASLATPGHIPAYGMGEGLRSLYLYPARQGLYETDPIFTLFGNRSIPGVIGSATVFEGVVSKVATSAPSWMDHKWGRKAGRAGRIIAIGYGAYLVETHVSLGIGNIQREQRYMANYARYREGLPPLQ